VTFNNRFMRADAISLTLYTTVFYNPTVLLSLLESLCLVKSSLDFVRKYLFECVFNSLCFFMSFGAVWLSGNDIVCGRQVSPTIRRTWLLRPYSLLMGVHSLL